jgi:2'-5' RNA ligase
MRLFLAIELSDETRRHLAGVQEHLRGLLRNVSWTKPENLHLTLKFLDEVPDDQVKAVCDALSAIPPVGPFPLAADGLTCFPPHGAARIITAGMQTPPPLQELVNHIEATCKPLGFPLEGRAYRAHVTLARARTPLPPPLRQAMEQAAHSLWPGPETLVEEFILMQSQLKREGAIYTPAARFLI